ncbi:MAG: CBS domain-containing protein [Bauldia sp.]|nr:CBS domain-containing protein [Bauldia sp.]
MLVRDYLPTANKRLVVLSMEATIRDAARELAQPGIDLIVVADPRGKLAGVVTDSDVVTWVAEHPNVVADSSVQTLMSTKTTTCKPSQTLTEVAEVAQKKGLKHLPIVDDAGKPLGVIYVREALMSLLHEAEINEQWLKQYLSGTSDGRG